ncbi:hypothetical protein ACFFMN_32010 [Planobispora siamensis]|uniref:Uncharacterized protein n=1 Tax=Planobispora siamensis TaxID=936338 RepID=A0A8J3WJQ2_9ACTN|nr:hypothetical protein [Planobispora siamensis]GIH90917.1 hypothetical protein Psi01_15470 [Planobispora siamensis]
MIAPADPGPPPGVGGWSPRENFDRVFEAHFAEIHRYIARRLYAELPQAASAREVTGLLGRRVVAVTSGGEEGDLGLGDRDVQVGVSVFIDPSTGLDRGGVTVAVKDGQGFPAGTVPIRIAEDTGWTDEQPRLPAGCRPKTGATCR